MLRIGSIQLGVPFYLAPLSGYSDLAMRKISRRFGSPLGISGLLMDKMVLHSKGAHQPIAVLADDEHPVGAQLLGADPDTMSRAAVKLCQMGYDLIDLNFCCPAPKVVRSFRGGFLMSQPELILKIISSVRHAIPCPLTIKLRIGYDESGESQDQFWKVCRQAKSLGVDAVAVHGRTVTQRFHGRANWDVVANVKRELSDMPVIGSGDLGTVEAAAEKIKGGLVDAVVIARGAIGNPWFFSELRAVLAGETRPAPPAVSELGQVMLEHFDMLDQLMGDHKAVTNFRKFLPGYCKRHPHRKAVLLDLMGCQTGEQLKAIIHRWGAEIPT